METKVQWMGEKHFRGFAENKTPVDMDDVPNGAPTPMEIQLMSLASCGGMDIVSMLKKMRQELTAFDMTVNGERATEAPKVFTKIHIDYHLSGKDLDPASVEKSIRLSYDKYCSILAMLRPGVNVTYSYKITPRKEEICSTDFQRS
jgi:putative redox protein